MRFDMRKSRGSYDEWRVETIPEQDEKGEGEVAVFSGPDAQNRANAYQAWKNGHPAPRRDFPEVSCVPGRPGY